MLRRGGVLFFVILFCLALAFAVDGNYKLEWSCTGPNVPCTARVTSLDGTEIAKGVTHEQLGLSKDDYTTTMSIDNYNSAMGVDTENKVPEEKPTGEQCKPLEEEGSSSSSKPVDPKTEMSQNERDVASSGSASVDDTVCRMNGVLGDSDSKDEDVNSLIEGISNMDEKKKNEVWNNPKLTDEAKKNFFERFGKELGVEVSLGGKGKWVGGKGSMVYETEGGSKVDLDKIEKFVSDGGWKKKSYDFRGKKIGGVDNHLKSVKVSDSVIEYVFDERVVKIEGSGGEFDIENLKIKTKSGDEYSIFNGGEIEINKDGEITLSVIKNKDKPDDLKNFPILKDKSGNEYSPYFVKGGDGKADVKKTVIKPGAEGKPTVVSEGFVGLEDKSGEVFTSKDMSVFLSGDKPKDIEGSYFWKAKGKIEMVSRVGKGYYHQLSDLDEIALGGDVLVKNGNLFMESEGDKIKFRKADKNVQGLGDFSFGKLYNTNKPDESFKYQKGGDVMSSDNKVVFSKDGLTVIPKPPVKPGESTPPTPGNFITQESDPTNYAKGVYGGKQIVKYTSTDAVKKILEEKGTIRVKVTEPSWCGPCRNDLSGGQDPNVIYLTNAQVQALGGRSGSIPRWETLTK